MNGVRACVFSYIDYGGAYGGTSSNTENIPFAFTQFAFRFGRIA